MKSAQRSYPDLAVGFLLCFFLLSNGWYIFNCSLMVFVPFQYHKKPLKTKKPTVRAGSRISLTGEAQKPGLSFGNFLLRLLGVRITKHDSSPQLDHSKSY
jgi:hypothetical protein